MKKLLITGFDPFGGEKINPAWEAVKRLPDVVGDLALTRLMVPTVFGLAGEKALEAAQALSPDYILCVGQAGGRSAVTPEVVGINLRVAGIPDNAGNQPRFEPCDKEGANAYFATLPVEKMVSAIREAGLPASLSFSAGAFVCNDLLYTVLRATEGTAVRAGFIHVPYLPEQTKDKPSLPLSDIVKALTAAIRAINDEA